ncbi:MAG: lipopolysaccharide assembly protein LapA domain-containing protein [Afipia sp.]
MLRKIFNALVLLPLAILFVVFAVANRHIVTLSFDPFNSSDPALGVSLPLFVVIIAVAMFGVVAGGVATWFGQRHWRRAARQQEADARHARAELADLREQTRLATRSEGQVPALMPGLTPQYPAIGRDKHGAAL